MATKDDLIQALDAHITLEAEAKAVSADYSERKKRSWAHVVALRDELNNPQQSLPYHGDGETVDPDTGEVLA